LGCKGAVSKADVEQAAKLVGPTVATKACGKHNDYLVVTSSWIQYMGVSKNRGTPKWMVYNGNPHICSSCFACKKNIYIYV